MALYFHITDPRRLRTIMRDGLRPPVYLTDQEGMMIWLNSYLDDRYRSRKNLRASLVRVRIPESWIDYEEMTDVGANEFVVNRLIPPSKLQPDRITNLPSEEEFIAEQRGFGVRIRRSPTKRRSFGRV